MNNLTKTAPVTTAATAATATAIGGVTIGPDLNGSKSQLDKKEYRQILLSNGLRVILISDTIALHDQQDQYYDEEEEDDDDDGDDGDKKEMEDGDDNDDEENCEDEDDDDDSDEEDDDDGIRKAAAAIIVGAGSFHDPPHAQGLAHFLEHMLFMGSTKYPGENQYDAFLSKHSGSDNAYTELEHTVYHLDMICQEYFFEALDMLAQFFISPLMRGESVERELKSIESEFQLSKNSDECRLQQLFCHECAENAENAETAGIKQQKHPFGQFSWGNIKSLKEIPEQNGINMMKELRKFFNCHYYAQNMSLVVIGGYTLDELQKHVVASFSDISALPRMNNSENGNANHGTNNGNINGDETQIKKNTNKDGEEEKHDEFYSSMTIQRKNAGTWEQSTYTPIQKYGMPFNSKSLCNINRIVPVKDKHNLSLTWQIPPQWTNWKSKPVDSIAHLLGHEGKGSLLSLLKSKSFVNECYAGVGSGGYENASSHALFCMTFTLSDNGVKNWMEIVKCVYMYIGMMRFYCQSDEGLPIWIYEELKAIQDLAYRFADEENPTDLVETIADCLVPYHALPPERLLDGDSLLFEYDGDAIKNLLDNYFIPQNSRVDIISSSFGRAADFEVNNTNDQSQDKKHEQNDSLAVEFSPEKAGPPLVEPIFGTQYWSHRIPSELIEEWYKSAEPQLPPPDSMLSLPPVNPFIPKNFALKALPADDSHHPLLFCSLKLCILVGKKKAWFPCTVNKYDGTKNAILLVYEDEEEKWHKVDLTESEFSKTKVNPNFEGTLDSGAIKYKVISVPKEGEGAVLKYGDESDWHVEDGIHFPHVPPSLPESRLPQLVHNTKLLKLWHLQDRKFKRPVAELRLKIACLHANKSPLQKACAELLAMLIHDATTEIGYLASVCELGNSIRATDFGFTVRVNGFDDKLLNLTDELLKAIFGFNTSEVELPQGINPDRFDACLEVLLRRYNNEGMRASSLCSDVRIRCLRPNIWSAHTKANAIKDVTVARFMDVVSNLLKNLSIEAFFIGNVNVNDAEAAKELITKATACSKGIAKNKHPKQEVLIVTSTDNANVHNIVVPTIDPQEPNTAVEIYIQCGKDDIKERVLLDLLVQIMYEPLFDQLRTKEQLGYQVSCGTRWTYGVMGINFKVVTTCKSADQVNMRIEEFLREFRKEIVDMSKETYMEHVVGLAKNKLEKFNSLEEEAGSLWYEITERRYDWEVHRNEAHTLRSITKDEVIKAFDDWLCPTKELRRRLIVHAIGTTEGVSSDNRPTIPSKDVGSAIDNKVKAFHRAVGNKTWGKIF